MPHSSRFSATHAFVASPGMGGSTAAASSELISSGR
jgi:hypothetical protein